MAQLKQAISGSYEDWHPPMMAWFWSILIKLTGVVESLFIFHCLVLLASGIVWILILKKLHSPFFILLAIPLLFASPIVTVHSGMIWKNVGFAYVMLLSCGLLSLCIIKKRYSVFILTIMFLFLIYSFGIRLNGVFAIIPIVFFLIQKIVLKRGGRIASYKTNVISLALSITILFAAGVGIQFFYYKILDTKKIYITQYILFSDIIGVSAMTGHDYLPDYVKNSPSYNRQKTIDVYKLSMDITGNLDFLFFYQDRKTNQLKIPLHKDAKSERELKAAWFRVVLNHPLLYLKNRWVFFNSLMSRGVIYPGEMFRRDVLRKVRFMSSNFPEKYKHPAYQIQGHEMIKKFVEKNSDIYFLRIGWLWFTLLLVGMGLGLFFIKDRYLRPIIMIVSTSGFLHMAHYFFITQASDFRYLYWPTLAGSITFVLIALWFYKTLKRRIVHP